MSNILIILCLVVIGLAGFFFGLFYVVCQVVASVGRRIARPFGGRRHRLPLAGPVTRRRSRACPNRRCGHVDDRAGRFCSQCGEALKVD